MPSLLQSNWRHVCLLVSNVCMPCSTLGIINTFVLLQNFYSFSVQRNVLFGLMNSLNGCMISLMEWAQATWLTKANQDQKLVIYCGTWKSLTAERMLLEGVISNCVMLRPACDCFLAKLELLIINHISILAHR